MSTVEEIKTASEQLSPEDRWELFRWLGQAKDLRRLQLEDLRNEIEAGLREAQCGGSAPLDVRAIKSEVRRRLAGEPAR